jgi:(p)ppGpp synthase/HD superfamily hydrolase
MNIILKIRYFTMLTYTKSLVFAAEKHKNQRRKQAGDVPYINHPL